MFVCVCERTLEYFRPHELRVGILYYCLFIPRLRDIKSFRFYWLSVSLSTQSLFYLLAVSLSISNPLSLALSHKHTATHTPVYHVFASHTFNKGNLVPSIINVAVCSCDIEKPVGCPRGIKQEPRWASLLHPAGVNHCGDGCNPDDWTRSCWGSFFSFSPSQGFVLSRRSPATKS